jgi:uncharacterized protein (DUF885 family)
MLPRLLASILLFTACAIAVRAADDDQPIRFDVLVEQYYDEYLALFPIEAAINGDNDHRYDAVWPDDLSLEHRAKVAAMCDKYLDELGRHKRAKLLANEQVSFDSLKWTLEARRDQPNQIYWMLPVNQFSCPTLTFAQMASGSYLHPFNTPQDFRSFRARAKGFSRWVDTAIANMRTGMAKGVVQPRIIMERVLDQLQPLTVDDAEANILFGPLKKLPANLLPPDKEKLAAEYRDGVRTIMLPAYQRLHDFIRDEYLPKCRDTAGIGAVPGGKDAYAWSVRWQTTTNLTPDQIHEIGLKEVARIRGEMEKVQAQVGFKGSLNEFLNFVATDPQFSPYKTDEEVLNGYRAIENRVMAAVPKFFRKLPHMKFEVRATEKFRAAAASAEYIVGTADGARPGIFYVPIPDVAKFRTPRMEDLFLHEAIPGHHFQLALALENFSLPKFRRYDANNAFVEGWALYCESIGRELGMYTDPYQYFGMLLGDMHRAIRLVVDTGMHAKGWTREQALAYAAENEGGSPERQVAEIERYMAWPGQALGYKIGQLKISELRARGEQAKGAKFDLAGFHDQILGEGALPLSVLEARVDAWLAK